MSFRLLELERVEARVLGAVRCVDAVTGTAVDAPLQITADGARLIRNRTGSYVIREWDQLADHIAAFDAAPTTPPVGSKALTLRIADATGRYMPRLAQLKLPLDPDPGHAGNANSLFRPTLIALFPTAAAATGANWSLLRVRVSDGVSGDGLGGALLLVIADGKVIARGLTDWRGEALVPVAGVPVTTFSNMPGPVMVNQITVTLRAIFDAASGTRTAALAVQKGLPPQVLPQVDPDFIEANAATLKRAEVTRDIAARSSQNIALQVSL